MLHRIRPAIAVVLGSGLLLCASPASAGQATDTEPSFYAEPAPGSSTEAGGGYFELDVSAGETVTQSLALRNDSDASIELHLASADAATAQTGGSSFGLDTDVRKETGTWLTLDRSVVTLAARESLTLPFRITVPADARSGVHLAGISVWTPTTPDADDRADGGAGAKVTVQSRRVVAVQLNLPGPADARLVITGVTPVARPDGLYLEMAVDNRGRGLTHGDGDITMPDDDFAEAFTVGTFVPGTSIAYPIRWTEGATPGDHRTHVEIRYGDRVAVWDGVVTVDSAVTDEQANRQIDTPTPDDADGFPWALVVGGALGALTALVVGIVVGRRSRHDEPVSA